MRTVHRLAWWRGVSLQDAEGADGPPQCRNRGRYQPCWSVHKCSMCRRWQPSRPRLSQRQSQVDKTRVHCGPFVC